MSNSPPPTDDPNAPSMPRPITGDELLPPVEPPSAGFIIQLFVIPAVIVMLIVGVWLTVSWLVHRTRPQDLVQGLRGTGVARWQKASELADILRNERFADFRRDEASAASLADILKREIEAAGDGKGFDGEAVMLRFFLCRALGEFETTAGIDALVLAANTNRDPAEQLVRRGAVQGLAMRAFHAVESEQAATLEDSPIEEALLRLASDEDPVIRSEAAFALGRIGTPAALEKLAVLVGDPHADTRYNAAVALAHRGNAAGVNVLAEMLEPVSLASAKEEPDAAAQVRKRTTILRNAMKAARELKKQNPLARLDPIEMSLRELAEADEKTLEAALILRGAASEAKTTLEALASESVPTNREGEAPAEP
jgi:HEAT repeat protein